MSRSRGMISVIVPVLDEEAVLARTLERLREPEILEVIVVDGGSRDQTCSVAAPLADRVLVHQPGRARQMNLGAATARGSILMFLHADTLVPRGFGAAITRALERSDVIGGRFDVELDDDRLPFRVIAAMITLRSRLTNRFTGDQAIFVRRAVFEQVGGYVDEPLLEDLALSTTLARIGEVAALHERVVTSARRWKQFGVVRTVFLMWAIRTSYAVGIAPGRLVKWYRHVRFP